MERVLVLVEQYPNNEGRLGSYFVHTRDLYYKDKNIDVTVVDYAASENYTIDGIKVIRPIEYEKYRGDWEVLIVHAANLRNHYRFLRKYGDDFKRIIFFFHGHEVMRLYSDYSKPYPYVHPKLLRRLFQDVYDSTKLLVWHHYFKKYLSKLEFVFVSMWMKEVFMKNVRLSGASFESKSHIIYNSVGEEFIKNSYDENLEKKYDYISIRSNIDGSKYCVDVINELALNTPGASFLLIGKGDYFEHYKKAPNLVFQQKNLTHSEIIEVLNCSKFALMPTRTDAQGLMMCEMAAFGIPVITSNIPVCHEVFDDHDNVFFIDNDDSKQSLEKYSHIKPHVHKDKRYYPEATIEKEIELIREAY